MIFIQRDLFCFGFDLTDKPSARAPPVFERFSAIVLLCRARYRPPKPITAKPRPMATAVL